MKNLILIALSSLIYFTSKAQNVQIDVYAIDSVGCEKQMYFGISNNTNNSDQGVFTIDWGDGSTDDQIYSIPANSFVSYVLNHLYQNPGNYAISVTAESQVLGSNISIPQANQVISAVGQENCAYAYIGYELVNSCFSYNLSAILLDFTDVNNNTTTISSTSNWYNIYNGLNPSNAPYTVSVNDNWLLNNNMTQISSDLVITDFQSSGEANLVGSYFTIDWTSAPINADPLFYYGAAWNFVAPMETGNLYIDLANLNCAPMNSNLTVTVEMPALFLPDLSNLSNASVTGNVLTFQVSSFSGYNGIFIPFSFPGTTPSGTQICFNVQLSYPNDMNLNNNSGQICGIVLNSYDPNDKQVNAPERLNPDLKEKLTYRIQFQNDGNYNAINVKITDLIDNQLNLSTLRVVEASHGVQMAINNQTRQVDFNFNNIFLGSSSDNLELSRGYVVYEIEENENLALGAEIENTANIYFDFNPAIVTNTTYNVNLYPLGVNQIEKENNFIFPNPANNIVKVQGDGIIGVQFFDVAGKLVLSSSNNSIEVDSLTNGLYTVVIQSIHGESSSKLSIAH